MFVYITYRQPHFVKPLLQCKGTAWDMKLDAISGGGGSFGYHGFTLRKAAPQASKDGEALSVDIQTVEV